MTEANSFEQFKKGSDAILARRMKMHREWANLKQSCTRALRQNNVRVRETLDRIRERDIEDVEHSNYSAYAEDAVSRGEAEPFDANPDRLAEADAFWAQEPTDAVFSEGQMEAAVKLLAELQKVLTPNQFWIYVAHVEEKLSLSEIARRKGVDVHALHWNTIEAKIQKHFKSIRGGK